MNNASQYKAMMNKGKAITKGEYPKPKAGQGPAAARAKKGAIKGAFPENAYGKVAKKAKMVNHDV